MERMKVLLCAPQDGHTELYLSRAFEKLGHQVDHFDYRQDHNPDTTLAQLTDYDLTLVLKGERFSPAYLRNATNCVLWNFDLWYRQEPWFLELAKAAKVFLTPAGGDVLEELRAQGINAHYMPEAADPELHRPIYNPSKEDKEHGADVTFIGTVKTVPGRDEWLQSIGKWCDDNSKVFKIWGSFPGDLSRKWHMGRAGPAEIGDANNPGVDEDRIHNLIVSTSNVILDRQRNPEIEGAVSARVFRTLAARGFLLARHIKGIEKLFSPGWDIITYKDDEECVQLIENALGETQNPFVKDFKTDHSLERKVIGRHGWDTVMAKHLWTHRVQELLKLL